MPRRICVFTGSRADYGLLYWLMKEIEADPRLALQLVVSGSHLAPQFGETRRQIEADGFEIDAEIDMQLADDKPVALANSMALALKGCAEALDRLRPDLLVVLGDRYEALAAAEAAMLLRVPIAHIHGGEATEGAIDDAIRHAISKMAHLHFPAAEAYRQRIIQLGEHPDRVFTVGAPGLDHVGRTKLLDRAEIEAQLGFRLRQRNLLVTYHPVTLERAGPSASIRRLFEALDRFPDTGIVLTKSNADSGGREINELIDGYAAARTDHVVAATSLGQQLYLSVMAQADAVVGNSSSGIIEAPALGRPTVNIGTRQKGRVRAPSIVDCADETQAIIAAIERALAPDMQTRAARRVSPYGGPGASKCIKEIIAGIDLDRLLVKSFHTVAPVDLAGVPVAVSS